MTIRPEDLTGKTFRTRFRGLDPAEVTSHLEFLATELTALQERLEALEQVTEDQKTELDQAAEDRKAYEDVVDVFKDNLEKFKSEIRVKEQNGMELLGELERMKDQAAELVVERDGLKAGLKAKETQLAELESTCRKSRAAVDELHRKQSSTEEENVELKTQVTEFERQLEEMREQCEQLAEQSRKDSSRLIEAAQEEIERMRKEASLEILQLNDEIETLSSRSRRIREELRSMLTAHLQSLDDVSPGGRKGGDRYDDLFQKIDFTELAEFDEEPPPGDGGASGADAQGESESEERLKRSLADGGVAYLSDE